MKIKVSVEETLRDHIADSQALETLFLAAILSLESSSSNEVYYSINGYRAENITQVYD